MFRIFHICSDIFSLKKKIIEYRLTRRDSHKYFTDFDQFLHGYFEVLNYSEVLKSNPCKAVNCVFFEKIVILGHDDRSLLNLEESIDI